MATIASLNVILSATTAAFEKGITKAGKALGGLAGSAKTAGAAMNVMGVNLGAAAIVGGMVALVKSQYEAIDAMDNLSERTGVAIEDLSALAYAANKADVDIGTLTGGLGKLQVAIGKALGGDKGSIESFAAVGVTVDELKRMNAAEVIVEISDAMKKFDSTAKKSAATAELFGKGAKEMVQLLNSDVRGGVAGAGAAGALITAEDAANAAKFEETWKSLAASAGEFGRVMATGVLPALDGILTALGNIAKYAFDEGNPFLTIMKAMGMETRGSTQGTGAAPSRAKVGPGGKGFAAGATAIPPEAAKPKDLISPIIAQLQEEAAALTRTSDEMILWKATMEGATDAQLNEIRTLITYTAKLENHKKQLEHVNETRKRFMEEEKEIAKQFGEMIQKTNDAWKDFADGVKKDARSPLEEFLTATRDLDIAFRKGLISQEEGAMGALKAKDDLESALGLGEDSRPNALLRGSAEAFSAITRDDTKPTLQAMLKVAQEQLALERQRAQATIVEISEVTF